MTDNVLDFPVLSEPPALLIGPFETYEVIVQGRRIPGLTGRKREDGAVSLTVDGRFGAEFPNEEVAGQAAWLIAQAMAIASGYTHMEADRPGRPFASIVHHVTL